MDTSHLPIGKNIMHYRKKKGISLDELARRSGVSKSMLSQIEQEKTNPTVITVWKISRALDTTIEELVETGTDSPIEVLRRSEAPVFYSEDNSCEIYVNSPIHMMDNLELYTLVFKPHGALNSKPHYPKAEEFLTVISGHIQVTAGEFSATLNEGDTARYRADRDHSIVNLSETEATAYLVVIFP
ncbi:MAG TPA: helix-turn-helix domain-containing protein [Clostridiales bacterium]|nr:helix-turn-helix domain-containing protein [Clostridiales bacterium]